MPEMSNIDSNLVADMQRLANPAAPPPAPPVQVDHLKQPPETSALPSDPSPQVAPEAAAPTPPPPEPTVPRETSEPAPVQNTASEKASPIDEYGNPIAPPKMFTEEEMTRILNDRLAQSRIALKQQQLAQQQPMFPNQQPNQQQTGNNEDGNWQVELKQFIKKTHQEISQEEKQLQWQEQEQRRQAEFESKFNAGMGKYSDFHQVVSGKPITDGIMLAARALDNPAAFIYGAAKMHPQELDRIARIPDAYAQAAEVGRLHEKMVKQARSVSAAPKPIEPVRSDMAAKPINPQMSIDQRINEHAKQKFRR